MLQNDLNKVLLSFLLVWPSTTGGGHYQNVNRQPHNNFLNAEMFLNVVLCCVWNIEHCVGMTTHTQLTQLRDIYRQAQLRLCKLGPGTLF